MSATEANSPSCNEGQDRRDRAPRQGGLGFVVCPGLGLDGQDMPLAVLTVALVLVAALLSVLPALLLLWLSQE